MAILLSNNASTTLAAAITSAATEIQVATGTGAMFPTPVGSDYFLATLSDVSNNIEIVKVTARSGDYFTVVRAQESTAARAFSVGDSIELRLTAGIINTKLDTTGGTISGPLTVTGALTASGGVVGNVTGDVTGNVSGTAANVTGTVAVANGGTGATTAAAARTNLGLGSLSTASSVNDANWSGTDLALANGGTGASDAATARTNLGLGTMATLSTVTLTSNVTGVLPLANGGTGASDAATARTNLGLGTMATQSSGAYQPLDATLTALAGVTTAADKLIYATASDTFTTATITSFGRSLVAAADAAAAVSLLGANAFSSASLASPGYVVFANGFKIMWGSATAAGNATTAITYPTAFSSFSVALVSGSSGGSNQQDNQPGTTSCGLASFNVFNAIDSSVTVFWIAVGV